MAKSLSIQAEFVRYVGPSILGLAGTSCYILADTYFISLGAGSLGLTALNIALPIFNIIFGLGAMVGIGSATRYALRQDEKAFTQALWLAALFSLPFLALAAAPERLSAALGAKGEVLAITTEYLWVVLMFSPFFLLNTVIQCFVRNDGAPRLVMMGTLFGSLFNIVFDYIFIFPMGLGMFGAALATGCSPIVSLLVLSSHCLKKHNHFHCMRLGPRPAIAQDIARLGSAGFVTEVANGVVIFASMPFCCALQAMWAWRPTALPATSGWWWRRCSAAFPRACSRCSAVSAAAGTMKMWRSFCARACLPALGWPV